MLVMTESLVALIWQYEQGDLNKNDALELFRTLIHTGEIWNLPEHYLDQAAKIIGLGYHHKGGGQ